MRSYRFISVNRRHIVPRIVNNCFEMSAERPQNPLDFTKYCFRSMALQTVAAGAVVITNPVVL